MPKCEQQERYHAQCATFCLDWLWIYWRCMPQTGAPSGVELALVCDIDAARRRAGRAVWGAGRRVPQALSNKAIDAVLIASATPTHARYWSRRCWRAKRCTVKTDRFVAVARPGSGSQHFPLQVPVTVGFNRRFDRSHAQLKAQLQQGVIGQRAHPDGVPRL